jgi:hypothetical protein
MVTSFSDFSPIFGEKFVIFLENRCYDQFTSSILSKNENLFKKILGFPLLGILGILPNQST